MKRYPNLDLPSLLRILGCHQLQPLPSVQENQEAPASPLHLKDKCVSSSSELMYPQKEMFYLQWRTNTILLTTLTRPTINTTLSCRSWEPRHSFFTRSAWLTCNQHQNKNVDVKQACSCTKVGYMRVAEF